MKMLMVVLVFVSLSGCVVNIAQLKEEYAVNPTPALAQQIDEAVKAEDLRKERTAATLENWALCEALLARNNVVTFHIGHKHGHNDRTRLFDIKSDLSTNSCRMIIPKKYWR